ncbi:DUF3293 domain-containing protein [Roseomonas sp. KE0001]|uniref:DUF3293 domain-containing protein n=1 Tax=Roseomonas sp. KE0001 TaxID=2479201 RepID=UPI001E322303|nr:DUF3293 domain-containing protein [Roseomonas sp. KE0001]MBI0432775.1 DUF3293 domain-containing protein [Roseomonas sp. KE0001]
MISERLVRSFHQTRYEAGGATARIGRRSPSMRALLQAQGQRQGAIITAWNPLARRHPEGWNRRAQMRLEALARRVPLIRGAGYGRGWREEHCLIGCSTRKALKLARRFRQLAIVVIRRDGLAQLKWLRH